MAVGFIWSYIYSPECGLFKVAVQLLNNRDLMPPLADPKLAMTFVIIASSWHNVGIPMILFNACFVGMPPELLESAEIDGATGWRKIATHDHPPVVGSAQDQRHPAARRGAPLL